MEEEIVTQLNKETEQLNETVTADYGASQIQVLEGLEAVRRRPACISVPPTTAASIIW